MILREEDEGGRATVMRDDERVRPGRRLNIDQVMGISMQVVRWRESCI